MLPQAAFAFCRQAPFFDLQYHISAGPNFSVF
jgi:hypothetical protein